MFFAQVQWVWTCAFIWRYWCVLWRGVWAIGVLPLKKRGAFANRVLSYHPSVLRAVRLPITDHLPVLLPREGGVTHGGPGGILQDVKLGAALGLPLAFLRAVEEWPIHASSAVPPTLLGTTAKNLGFHLLHHSLAQTSS